MPHLKLVYELCTQNVCIDWLGAHIIHFPIHTMYNIQYLLFIVSVHMAGLVLKYYQQN